MLYKRTGFHRTLVFKLRQSKQFCSSDLLHIIRRKRLVNIESKKKKLKCEIDLKQDIKEQQSCTTNHPIQVEQEKSKEIIMSFSVPTLTVEFETHWFFGS